MTRREPTPEQPDEGVPRGRWAPAVVFLGLVLSASACMGSPSIEALVADLSEFELRASVYSPVSPPEEKGEVTPLDDMTSLYFAAAIADSTGGAVDVVGAAGVERVRGYADSARREDHCDEMLFAAAILHMAGEPVTELDRRAASCATERFRNDGVHRLNTEEVDLSVQIVERLGYSEEIPALTAEVFEVGDRLDRYRAWQMLALLPYIENKLEVQDFYRSETTEAGEFLNDPDGRALFSEVVAAYRVPGSVSEVNGVSDGLSDWLGSARGCGDSGAHYRASLEADSCALRDSWAGLVSGLIPR
ncbi:hypothetical protein [Streptomyces bohaiensis]|uniref:Lipoprotein n=1 Tax=Streptomyces bohaiensis TaxID=1431344 RepID=A0ABX1CB62_9ACTN|nr:hypothetical protein [Streptomyces bohaiensis]NJQ13549.1 hypothetical protein [Streptomyces bohaiensis]